MDSKNKDYQKFKLLDIIKISAQGNTSPKLFLYIINYVVQVFL